MILSAELLLLLLAFAKYNGIDPSELSAAIRNGDHEAFKMFYEEHYDGLFRFMVSRGMSHAEAQDLVQKAFVMIWEKRIGIDETKSLRAYLFQIAYSRMLNHVEYHSKFNDDDPPEEDVATDTPETDVDYKELLRIVKQAILNMPEKRGQVFESCFMNQYTYKETAEAMEVSVKTVENHMTLAFKDLRRTLTEKYGDEVLSKFTSSQ
ncbi:MAG: sigma-70 family RNA polymerase sigma factor [Balneolaceae bacterium]